MRVSIDELRDGVLYGPQPTPAGPGIIGAIVGEWTICAPCSSRLCGRGLGYWLDGNIFDGDEHDDCACDV